MFDTHSASTHDVVDAGEKALVIIQSGKSTDTLDSLRYQCICEKVVSKSSHVKPQTLPPTSGAEKYHSLRVYLHLYLDKFI